MPKPFSYGDGLVDLDPEYLWQVSMSVRFRFVNMLDMRVSSRWPRGGPCPVATVRSPPVEDAELK